ncbi:MAG: tail-specific protease, partial [Gammaproteobacteria bacterium]
MNILRPTIHITLLLALALGYASAWSRVDPAEYPQSLVPEETHADTANEVTKRLTRSHYRKVLFDDTLSSKVFDRYLAVLDPARVYFTAADIDEFERYRHQIDDLLRDGELGPAYRIYNRYQVRLAEQLAYMVNHLESGLDDMDFGILDEIEIDRREAAWPADRT